MPAVLALVVLAIGTPLAWIGATPITDACLDAVSQAEEGAQVDSRASLWPPGVRCITRSTDGTQVEVTYVTWYELTFVALAALAVGLVSAMALRAISVRRFTLSAAAVLAAFLAASAGFFL